MQSRENMSFSILYRKIPILVVIVAFFMFFSLQAQESGQKTERVFKPLKEYRMSDFNFKWKIRYLEMLSWEADSENAGECFALERDSRLEFVMRLGERRMNYGLKMERFHILEKLSRKNYFWKTPWPPSSLYGFTGILFVDDTTPHFKAVSSLDDIKDMFGDIDREAELSLWLRASGRGLFLNSSYLETKDGYRVRFKGVNPFTCIYTEYFEYYDKRGKLLETKILKKYRKKGCVEVIP